MGRRYRGPLTIRRQSSAGTKASEVEPFTQDGLQRRTAHPMPGVPDVRPDRALRRARGRLTGAGLPRVPRRPRPGARALAELSARPEFRGNSCRNSTAISSGLELAVEEVEDRFDALHPMLRCARAGQLV